MNKTFNELFKETYADSLNALFHNYNSRYYFRKEDRILVSNISFKKMHPWPGTYTEAVFITDVFK